MGQWSQALQERVEDSGELAAGQDQSSAFMFAYVDKISDVLVEEFGTERERMMRSAAQLRAETVRAILAGEPVDEEVASRRLGYDLRRHHVAAHRGRGSGSRPERAGGRPRRRLAGEPPSWPAPRGSTRGGAIDAPATDVLERYEPRRGARRLAGGDGIPDSAAARRGAGGGADGSLAPDAAVAVTSYARVEVVSLSRRPAARLRLVA